MYVSICVYVHIHIYQNIIWYISLTFFPSMFGYILSFWVIQSVGPSVPDSFRGGLLLRGWILGYCHCLATNLVSRLLLSSAHTTGRRDGQRLCILPGFPYFHLKDCVVTESGQFGLCMARSLSWGHPVESWDIFL